MVSSMVIVCEGCGARFRMNHALFQDAKGARIRCRKCGGQIEVLHPDAPRVPPAPAFFTEIPDPQTPSSDAAVPPAKPDPEKEAPHPEEAVVSPSVPVADTAPFPSSGDNAPDASPHLADLPWEEPGRETSDVLEESPTFQADISNAVQPETAPSPPEEHAILPVSASIEAEPTHAQPARWMETDPTPDAPDAAPAGEPEAAAVPSEHPGRWDTRLEELFLQPVVTDDAPAQDSSREERSAEIASLRRRLKASRRRGPSMLAIYLLVVPGILLLAGAAFFLRDTKLAQELLRKFSPPSESGNTASAVEKPVYEIREMKSSYAKTFIGGNLFVIQGIVANVGKSPSRGIRIQATLLGKDNQALVNSTVFAANLVDNTTLRHANRALIEGYLGVRYGEGNVNRDIPAGMSLPFMVVFFDPPGQVEYFTAKALDAK